VYDYVGYNEVQIIFRSFVGMHRETKNMTDWYKICSELESELVQKDKEIVKLRDALVKLSHIDCGQPRVTCDKCCADYVESIAQEAIKG